MSKDSELSPDAGGKKGHLLLPLSFDNSMCRICGLCGLLRGRVIKGPSTQA